MGYQTDVSMNMTQHLFTKPEFENNNNIVFSPLSLFNVLGIGSEGPTQRHQANSTDDLNSFSSQLISTLSIAFSLPSMVFGLIDLFLFNLHSKNL
jgi:hypothetical protein